MIDAGSKTFGLDKGAHGADRRDGLRPAIGVEGTLDRLSEEHGILRGPAGVTARRRRPRARRAEPRLPVGNLGRDVRRRPRRHHRRGDPDRRRRGRPLTEVAESSAPDGSGYWLPRSPGVSFHRLGPRPPFPGRGRRGGAPNHAPEIGSTMSPRSHRRLAADDAPTRCPRRGASAPRRSPRRGCVAGSYRTRSATSVRRDRPRSVGPRICGRQAGHLVDRRFRREQPALADVAPEDPRERAVAARMHARRRAGDAQLVGADAGRLERRARPRRRPGPSS